MSWDRFTEKARHAIYLASEEAARQGAYKVSSEHIILGLIQVADTFAARILECMGIKTERFREKLAFHSKTKELTSGQESLELTPQAQRLIEFAYDEARKLNCNYIGTEHLLLGALRNTNSDDGMLLSTLGVTCERVRICWKTIRDEELSTSSRPNCSEAT